ncbi:MAG: DUF937 domain-containing protein [Gaiellaceae bacterium]
MTIIDELLTQIPMGQLASQLGVDEQTAEQATRQALPALLSGMHANAQDPAGARSLAEAVGQHDNTLLDGGVDVNQVDTADGEKIVGHVFGDSRSQVINQLGGGLGGAGGSALIGKLLPLLAPIVMSYLARRLTQTGAGTPASSSTTPNAGLGDVLGGLLGGAGQTGGLGDLLGGLLGKGRR